MVKAKSRKSVSKNSSKKSPKHAAKATKKPADSPKRHIPTASAPTVSRSAETPLQHKSGLAASAKGQLSDAHAQTNAALNSLGAIKSQSGVDLTEKVKELVRLAQEQGYLTYNDINDALPDTMVSPEELDEIYIKLRNLDVEIVDQAEVDRVKQPEPEEEEDKTRLDILDDPVRMYLKEMGSVPLLTREEEVEISKRIEKAQIQIEKIIDM